MDSIHMSPIDFFQQANAVGKTVILLLLLASVWCWVLIIEGVVGVTRLNGAMAAWRGGKDSKLLSPILVAGQAARAYPMSGETAGEMRQRIVEAMNRSARDIVARLDGGLANLAVISSVSPFVGLFGTVWGIMGSFGAIAQAKDTSLAVVAPGISEALATTAIGLAAAIPAAIAFNRIGAAMSGAAQKLSSLVEARAVEIAARTN